MPKVLLSNGFEVLTEDIEQAEYYPPHSLDGYGCHFGGAEMRACPYLFVQTGEAAHRVDGLQAGNDADLLEASGVRVLRHVSTRHNRQNTVSAARTTG